MYLANQLKKERKEKDNIDEMFHGYLQTIGLIEKLLAWSSRVKH